jgi:hypothetical protein
MSAFEVLARFDAVPLEELDQRAGLRHRVDEKYFVVSPPPGRVVDS